MVVHAIKIILLVCLVTQIGYTQSTSWIKSDINEKNLRYFDGKAVDDTYVFLAHQENRLDTLDRYDHFILRIDNDGDTLNFVELAENYFSCELYSSISRLEETDGYLIQGLGGPCNVMYPRLLRYWISLVTDYDFNVLSRDTVDLGRLVEPNVIVDKTDEEGNVYCLLTCLSKLPEGIVTQGDIYFKHDKFGNLVTVADINVKRNQFGMVIEEDRVVTFGDSIKIYNKELKRLSSTIGSFGTYSFPGQFAQKINNHYYYSASATWSSPDNDQAQYLLKLDSNFQLINYVKYPKLADVGFFKQCLDHYDGKVFHGVNNLPGFPGGSWYTHFKITKLDLDLKEEWSLIHGVEFVFKNIIGMLATSDGGVLVYGYHEDLNNEHDYPMIVKFDKDGNISTSTQEIKNYQYVQTYQSPSQGLFRVRLIGFDSEFQRIRMVDQNGNLVFKDDVQSDYERDLSHLPRGTYIFTIIDNSRPIISEKWIKI